jgi:rhamnogalacturonan endolyase
MMTQIRSQTGDLRHCFFLLLVACTATAQTLYTDDFRSGTNQWTGELEKGGTVAARGGVLTIDVPAGCTLWFKPELRGAVSIEYEARMVQAGGPNDRVSDLNAFWMATDTRSPGDLFATKRTGQFADYDQLRTYYVGQGGNSNTTTRFRRYIGQAQQRPLLPEDDLKSPLLQANVWQKIRLVAMGSRIQYYAGGKLLFDFNDPNPYTRGHFAFRTTDSHIEIRNFSVRRAAAVETSEDAETIHLDNGLVALTYSKRTGNMTRISRHAGDELRDLASGPDAYYWDCNTEPDEVPAGVNAPNKGYYRMSPPQSIKLVSSADAAEIIASTKHSTWLQFDVDLHFVLHANDSGFYAYAVFHHPAGVPAATLDQTRFVSKTVTDGSLTEFVIGDERIRNIPTAAVEKEVMNATYLLADGTIKTKYQNSSYWADTLVYGEAGPQVGIWSITASPEYHNGGPLKQGQTVHDNVLLRVLQSVHFGAAPVQVAAGEEWRKVYGPVFTYINSGSSVSELWEDAKKRQSAEAAKWPYQWVTEPAYLKQRGALTGQWKLTDRKATQGAWVVLADRATAENPDWTLQSKGYQFWAKTTADGKFAIRNVIPGTYTLYVSGADQPQQYARDGIEIRAGETATVNVDWTPETHGATLWQIGTFDRTAAEFRNGGDARQYEMFRRYPQDFPHDVTFTIGESDPAKDWNYAQWTWFVEKPYWTIRFQQNGLVSGVGTLTLAFASAQPLRGRTTNLQVKINGTLADTIRLPKTGTAGYRGSAQDSAYNVRTVSFDAALLQPGWNEITLGHANGGPFPAGATGSAVGQVMYDALRLEVARTGR